MNTLRVLLCVAALVSSTYGHCYDAQVAADQFFDDSFVCNEKVPYPAELIESDLNNLQNLDLLYFLDTATTCFNETNYFTRSFAAAGDYAYQCVCPSPRRRIEAVYMNQEVCFVVYPEKQDIQYAQCGGHCSFDYGTEIATASRGYFCVHQSFVQREFLVWCPNLSHTPNAPLSSSRRRVGRAAPSPGGVYEPFGQFRRVTQNLPTLCSCRGYFCDNHNVPVAPVVL